MTRRRPVMRQTDRDTLYEAAIFSKQATDDQRWEMDHREAPIETPCVSRDCDNDRESF
jgi:hypothetical protein